MKLVFFIAGLLVSCQSIALRTIYDGANSIASDSYLRLSPNQSRSKIVVDDNSSAMPGLPANSALQAGEFDSYRLDDCQKYPVAFFVIGADSLSIQWLKNHAKHLQQSHALGFVTNIKSEKQLQKLEQLSPIHLVPSTIDGLAKAIKAPSYPFFSNGCEVWQ